MDYKDFFLLMALLFVKQGIPGSFQNKMQLTFIFISISFLLLYVAITSLIGTTLILKDIKVINNFDDIHQDKEIAMMNAAYSAVTVILDKHPLYLKRRITNYWPHLGESDNAIGIFELSDPKYERYFTEHKIAIIGDEFMLNFMALTQCKNHKFKYHISDTELKIQNSFAMSRCIHPNVRRIFEQRNYLCTDYGLLKYAMENIPFKMVPKLLVSDLEECQVSSVGNASDIDRLSLDDFFLLFLLCFIIFSASVCIFFYECLNDVKYWFSNLFLKVCCKLSDFNS